MSTNQYLTCPVHYSLNSAFQAARVKSETQQALEAMERARFKEKIKMEAEEKAMRKEIEAVKVATAIEIKEMRLMEEKAKMRAEEEAKRKAEIREREVKLEAKEERLRCSS